MSTRRKRNVRRNKRKDHSESESKNKDSDQSNKMRSRSNGMTTRSGRRRRAEQENKDKDNDQNNIMHSRSNRMATRSKRRKRAEPENKNEDNDQNNMHSRSNRMATRSQRGRTDDDGYDDRSKDDDENDNGVDYEYYNEDNDEDNYEDNDEDNDEDDDEEDNDDDDDEEDNDEDDDEEDNDEDDDEEHDNENNDVDDENDSNKGDDEDKDEEEKRRLNIRRQFRTLFDTLFKEDSFFEDQKQTTLMVVLGKEYNKYSDFMRKIGFKEGTDQCIIQESRFWSEAGFVLNLLMRDPVKIKEMGNQLYMHFQLQHRKMLRWIGCVMGLFHSNVGCYHSLCDQCYAPIGVSGGLQQKDYLCKSKCRTYRTDVYQPTKPNERILAKNKPNFIRARDKLYWTTDVHFRKKMKKSGAHEQLVLGRESKN